jgi:hypothetical protein
MNEFLVMHLRLTFPIELSVILMKIEEKYKKGA